MDLSSASKTSLKSVCKKITDLIAGMQANIEQKEIEALENSKNTFDMYVYDFKGSLDNFVAMVQAEATIEELKSQLLQVQAEKAKLEEQLRDSEELSLGNLEE